MEILNLRIDKDNNLCTSLAGLLYLIENNYIMDEAVILKKTDSDLEEFMYFNDIDGIDIISLGDIANEDEIDKNFLAINENSIESEYIIEEGGYNFEVIDEFDDYDDEIELYRNILNGDYKDISHPIFESDDFSISYILDDENDPLTKEEEDDLIDFINDMFSGFEDNKPMAPRRELLSNNIGEDKKVKEINDKKYSKNDILDLMIEEHKDISNAIDLSDILKEVKSIME